uniref:HMG box domain-containing protein n=1 Tax=Glossina brevipalpis TaxID=37001 RepID=A0A1A9WDV4_9MUSC
MVSLSEWEQKAVKMKEEYNKAVKEYEANGGTDTGAGKKRKSKAAKPAKKAKKKETSEEEEEEESE